MKKKALKEEREKYYTITEVSEMLSISRSFILKLINTGEIKGVKIAGRMWRIPESELRKLIGEEEKK